MVLHSNVLVIGIDGGSWNLINCWIDHLPTIREMSKNGVFGFLESSIPPVTFPAWRCYSSGKNPGKIGVFGWHTHVKEKNFSLVSSLSFKTRDIWDYLAANRYKVCFINLPGTFPTPKIKNAVFIGGPFSSRNKGYTFPRWLQHTVEEKFSYQPFAEELSKNFFRQENLTPVIEKARHLINSRFEVAKDLIMKRNPDFVHLTIFCTDVLQHFLWNRPEVRDLWIYIDGKIGELLKMLDDNWTVFIISDHGFRKVSKKFNINVWLQQEGFLKILKPSKKWKLFSQLRLKSKKIYQLIHSLKIESLLEKLPQSLWQRLFAFYQYLLAVEEERILLERIDLERTEVFSPDGQCLYFTCPTSEKERLSRYLVSKLLDIRDPETNKPIFKNVWEKKDIYSGDFLEEAPDLVVNPTIEYKLDIKMEGDILSRIKKGEWIAAHSEKGIFVAYGSRIGRNMSPINVKIVDIAPTILYLFGLQAPQMDGRILHEIFKKDSFEPKKLKIVDF